VNDIDHKVCTVTKNAFGRYVYSNFVYTFPLSFSFIFTSKHLSFILILFLAEFYAEPMLIC
jgi:hypothetical protein